MIYIFIAIRISADDDLVGSGALNDTGILSQYTHTGVNGCFACDTGINNRSLCRQKRHCLTLHVRSHQRTVRIIVLQERNHGSCHGEYHLRGYVHQVDILLLERSCLFSVTSRNVIMNEIAIFIQWLIRLCNNEVVLFISGQINNIIRNTRVLRICLINHTIWRLDKSIGVYSCIRCQRVDQTDVRTLRGLNRAHTSIMGVVNISNLESGTISGQTARS